MGLYAAVDRDARLGGMRDDRIGPLGKQTVLGQFVQKGRRLELLVVGSDGSRAGRLEMDENNVTLLGLGRLYQAGVRSRMLGGRDGRANIRSVLLRNRFLCSCQDQIDEWGPDKRYASP